MALLGGFCAQIRKPNEGAMGESKKLWSEIVEEADPEPVETPEYEFSNGRKFYPPKAK